jgi:predicted anti-sigma-YlaC factor YlaD
VKITEYAKALLAGAIAFTGSLAVGYVDDALTKGELWTSIAAGVAALGVVFGVPNAKGPNDGR